MLKRLKQWHTGLSRGAKFILWSVAIGATVVAINGNQNNPDYKKSSDVQQVSSQQEHKPTTTTKEVTEEQEIPFDKTSQNDGSLEVGKTQIVVQGQNGIKTLTYEITLVDGQQTNKVLKSQTVTKEPVSEVTHIGTMQPAPTPAPVTQAPASDCDPNYAGACVPIASDVDCAGGSGNGPAYVRGPVRVIGTDIYGLDRDGDGIGCDR